MAKKATKQPEAAVEATNPLQDFKPFTQTPQWNSSDSFELKGNEFEAIYNLLNIFMPGINALQAAFERGIQSGVVTIKHEYSDGSGEVPKEELDRYFEAYKSLLEQQANLGK